MRRAVHQLLDRPPVFDDPLALRILDEASRREASAATDGPDRGLRAFMAVRSRLAEDLLAESGARQYVVLGAGLDTFGCRNPSRDLRVFEVDAPATQAWKRELLAAAGIPLPPTLTFAPVDFETETLAAGLASAGFAPGVPTFFSWLGVFPYLTREAAFGTLRFVAGLHPAAVVFDYALPRASLSVPEQLAFDAIASRVAKAGEPFRRFLAPE
jgi:methyltransferase (TIGR00027 family)